MAKRKKPLTCPVCKKKFYHSAKAHPIGRLSKHIAREHPRYRRKKKPRKRQLDIELETIDDILIKKVSELENRMMQTRQPVQHDVTAGAVIQGVMLGIELAKTAKTGIDAIKKTKKKKGSK